MQPVVIHIPHSSPYVPDYLRREMLLSDADFQQDIVAFTDWHTKDLFTHAAFPTRVVFPVNRMVCDPERFRSDEEESMAAIGIGAVYQRDAFLRPLRRMDVLQRELLLRLYYDPHHRALTDAVDKMLHEHGQCLIVDAHSFSETPLPYEPQQNTDRPDICIGTSPDNTPALLAAKAVRFFQTHGFSVGVNYPYSGTMVPLRFLRDPRVQSIMVEINRGLYRRLDTLRDTAEYAFMKNVIGKFLTQIAS